MSQDWTQLEVEATVADYFAMLQKELAGQAYSKAEHRRNLLRLLNSRSESSVEFKHQNISAVLVKLNLHYISGYKPRSNYQTLLEEVVIAHLKKEKGVYSLMDQYNRQKIDTSGLRVQYSKWEVEAPLGTGLTFNDPKGFYTKLVKKNYLEEEQRNASIGYSGEKLVYDFERWRLNEIGKPELAKKIEWVSQDKGDGAGFDILSKNADGSDRFIEVKTTTLGKETPIFFTRNEKDFSENHSDRFHMYRVFQVKNNPRMFHKHGSFSSFCAIQPTAFKGFF